MLDDDQLETAVRDLILDICEVMYRRGYDQVPIGAMMRLVGVAGSKAKQHDEEYFVLDDGFKNIIAGRKENIPKKAPPGETLH
jgi:hypothetical protein